MSDEPSHEELFKKLRREEVTAYHHLVRAMVMIGGTSQTGVYGQILSEVREILHIDNERHIAELRSATTAPDTLAVVANRIAEGKRTRDDREIENKYLDSDTDDDDRPPLRAQRTQKEAHSGGVPEASCGGGSVSSISSTADNEVAFLSLRVTSLKNEISQLTTRLKATPNDQKLLSALKYKKDHLSAVGDRLRVQQPSQ
eukprot:TRINITY_DN13742_c0_g1_i1.p1 TRINITY_DN13742_c0_g1~~TRINITY_DN13742_c0_g1_i1.p1  ORF type:complete len:213 (+),score=41.30 TRINITY_DN13742_c0_g1_i1:40-639(+)